ncbi:MAG: hypothetical protein WC269_02905 [Candidatus Gracilibacteria bacterium]|jgi:hypothetical protein
MKKLSLIVATLILLTLLAGCTAKKEEVPSTWTSYESSRFAFTFSYPYNYTLDNSFENTYEDQGFIHLYSNLVDKSSLIEFSAYKNPNELSILEWAKSDTAHSNFSDNYNEITVNGKSAISYSWAGMVGGDTILFKNKDFIISANVLYTEPNEKIRDDFSEIIKTIKF